MNEKRFKLFMNSIDDDLLEEAQAPRKRSSKRFMIAAVAVAACVCLVVSGSLIHSHNVAKDTLTASDIKEMGYTLPVPDGAKDVVYSKVDNSTSDSSKPIVQVTFVKDKDTYTCRALKTDSAEDISGSGSSYKEKLDWKTGSLDMQLRKTSSGSSSWVGWYSADDSTQWCLSSSDTNALDVLHTAQDIVDTLGYEMAVAPDNATDVTYNAMALDGLTVAETTFVLDGVNYSYRNAATSSVDKNFADISGKPDSDYAVSGTAKVSYCPARVYFNKDGSGKIVWFDVVPGLLYSVTMDKGADKATLVKMAEQLFTPAQGDVG